MHVGRTQYLAAPPTPLTGYELPSTRGARGGRRHPPRSRHRGRESTRRADRSLRPAQAAEVLQPDPPPPADRTPIGYLDQVAIKNGRLHIAGWSIDPDTTGSIKVQILVDGKHRQTVDASISRPDVAAAHPGYGDAHGFDAALDPPLRHTRVCVYGLNTNGGASGALGCGRAKSAFSVLSVNMQGTDSTWGPWRERWARIAGGWARPTRSPTS